MLNPSRFPTFKTRELYRALAHTVQLPKFHKPRSKNNLGLDYEFSLLLIAAGLIGVVVNTVTLTPAIDTVGTSVVQPTQNVVATANPSMASAVPTKLEIPAIGVSTDLITLGKNPDGSLETPTEYDVAGWYRYSPTPGEIGPAIITGHVDNYLGPAVFYNLKELVQGNTIKITREDGTIANFVVDTVKVFDQNAFPTKEVYGNIEHSGLRLITCGGNYNVLSGRYSHNVVVYASFIKP